ncbi:DUF1150 family protein [Hoeflea prorocentri]|uniref:DUF1150 family protein n=1 Tax=Hoeflea prorocentri TaxID=1922333 RepID=A0A9X3UPE6_9HYPH|nr:DUF1150 family protein [Hoeflea prorocentri]MCY6382776.1 DUF1150 family protein [Hoeflea prorocentri]MDA5400576.1 DUF1150 family protein [Hoeflea prorocentri]
MGFERKIEITKDELAHLGAGEVGYIRKISSDEVQERFPGVPKMESGIDLWGLFNADGTPLFLSDDPSTAWGKAVEDEINPVSVH